MERLHSYITVRQKRLLQKNAKIIGISLAELLRRVLDSYIEKDRKEKDNEK